MKLHPCLEGDRFADVLKFRRLGTGGGDTLYECWGEAIMAYAAAAVAAERERCAVLALNKALHCDDNGNHYGANAARDIEDAIRGQTP